MYFEATWYNCTTQLKTLLFLFVGARPLIVTLCSHFAWFTFSHCSYILTFLCLQPFSLLTDISWLSYAHNLRFLILIFLCSQPFSWLIDIYYIFYARNLNIMTVMSIKDNLSCALRAFCTNILTFSASRNNFLYV